MRVSLSRTLSVSSLTLLLTACGASGDRSGLDRGALAIKRYGCGSCHTIPGIIGAHGLVGPSLAGIRARVYVAGSLDNNASNLQRWIEDPHAINVNSAMPKLRVTPEDAADITQYLYSLE
jgi:cytochrome c